jgi:hypothetical protein
VRAATVTCHECYLFDVVHGGASAYVASHQTSVPLCHKCDIAIHRVRSPRHQQWSTRLYGYASKQHHIRVPIVTAAIATTVATPTPTTSARSL